MKRFDLGVCVYNNKCNFSSDGDYLREDRDRERDLLVVRKEEAF